MPTDKLEAMIHDGAPEIAGVKLRPLTGGTFALLQIVKNPLLEKPSNEIEDLFFHVASFVYLHSEDVDTVIKASKDADGYRSAVLGFAMNLPLKDLLAAGSKIQQMIERSTVGQDYVVEQGGGNESPN